MSVPKLGEKRYIALKMKLPLDLMLVDEELSEISVYIQEAGEFCATANETRDAAKQFVDQVEAEVSDKMRRTPDENGKTPSEANIKARLPLAVALQDAQQVLNQAELEANLWRNLQDALRTKSHSIRAAADLVQAGFITQDYIRSKRREEVGQHRQPVTRRTAVIG